MRIWTRLWLFAVALIGGCSATSIAPTPQDTGNRRASVASEAGNVTSAISEDEYGRWIALGKLGLAATSLTVTDDGTLYAVVDERWLYRSDSMASDWTRLDLPARHLVINALSCLGNDVLIGTMGMGVLLSPDRGAGWLSISRTVRNGENGISFSHEGDRLFFGHNGGIARTANRGRAWSNTTIAYGVDVRCISIDGDSVWAGARATGGVWQSRNGGRSWQPAGFKGSFITDVGVDAGTAFAITSNGMARTEDDGRSWAKESLDAVAFLEKVRGHLYAISTRGDVHIWDRGQRSWSEVAKPAPEMQGDVRSVAVKDSRLYVGTSEGLILRVRLSR